MSSSGDAGARLRNFFSGLDFAQIAAMIFLLGTGLTFIYSTGRQVGSPLALSFFDRQLQWIGIGSLLWLGAALPDWRSRAARLLALPYYFFCLILLVLVLVIGLKVFGATRWLSIGGFRLQPSEPVKLAVIFLLAVLYNLPRLGAGRFSGLLLGFLVTLFPFLLIWKEPDLGSALVLLPVFGAVTFCSGVKWRYVFTALAAGILICGVVYTDSVVLEKPVLLRGYQRDRIRVFLNPDIDRANRGHNAYQARLAVGSGGAFGKGIGEGTQNELGFLPQTVSNNDFIFSVIAEETGFAGVIALVTGYLLLFYSMLRTAFLSDSYGRAVAAGIAVFLFCHVFINIGMSLGAAPVTGLPLPLVSYGGSFILTTMTSLGILQSLYRYRNEEDS